MNDQISSVGKGRIKKIYSKESFLSQLGSGDPDEPAIVIGHNHNGRLYLPDGRAMHLAEIDSLAYALGRQIIYLSCNASNYSENLASSFTLTFSEALVMAKDISQKFSKPYISWLYTTDNYDMQSQLISLSKDRQWPIFIFVDRARHSEKATPLKEIKLRIKKMNSVPLLGLGLILLYMDKDDNQKKRSASIQKGKQ